MNIHELIGGSVAALVEYYDNTPACNTANRLAEQVKSIMGPQAPVYRINVDGNAKERSLVHIAQLPLIVIYRNGREEWRMTSNFPDAQTLATRLRASLDEPGAVSPLKGRHRV